MSKNKVGDSVSTLDNLGAGATGLPAAIRARDLGASVIDCTALITA